MGTENVDFAVMLEDKQDKNNITNIYYQNSLNPKPKTERAKKSAAPPKLSRKGHRQRLRRQYLSGDMQNAPDYILLELLISLIIPQKDVKPIAYDLINTFGTLENVVNAEPKSLMQVNGVGESVAVGIKMVYEINKHIFIDRNKGKRRLDSVQVTLDYFTNLLYFESVEKLIMTTVNANGELLENHVLDEGTATAASTSVSKIVHLAIVDRAAGVFFSHNHPNGTAAASANDINFTITLLNKLGSVGIRLIDHIIVGADSTISMRVNYPYFANGEKSSG